MAGFRHLGRHSGFNGQSRILARRDNSLLADFAGRLGANEDCRYPNSRQKIKEISGKIHFVQIAIDGPVSSGKSTISKLVAKKLGLVYIDTGAMYRTVALHCLRQNVDLNDESEVCARVKQNRLHFEFLPAGENNDGRNCTILLNGEDVSWTIREKETTWGASVVGRYECVRSYLVKKQQGIAGGENVVMEGRDIGYRVLPNADLKIFLTASEMVRSLRRQIHLLEHGQNGGLAKIREEIRTRDKQDMGRDLDPLKKVPGAVEIDTSDMTIEEVVDKIVTLVNLVKHKHPKL